MSQRGVMCWLWVWVNSGVHHESESCPVYTLSLTYVRYSEWVWFNSRVHSESESCHRSGMSLNQAIHPLWYSITGPLWHWVKSQIIYIESWTHQESEKNHMCTMSPRWVKSLSHMSTMSLSWLSSPLWVWDDSGSWLLLRVRPRVFFRNFNVFFITALTSSLL